MPHTVCTFNVNNLFLRYKFGQAFPGDISGKSRIAEGLAAQYGFLPLNQSGSFDIFAPEMRELAAKSLRRGGTQLPDVICFQEVESMLALREFNNRHLGKFYKYALLVDSYDLRQIDVGVLSNLEILGARSHVDDRDPASSRSRIFSRDCLEVTLALNRSGSQRLTLFINHFKSKLARSASERRSSDAKRLRQARAVAGIVKERFPGAAFRNELFAVVGDLNDEPKAATLAPLLGGSGLVNALDRMSPREERWTHYYRSESTVAALDYVLLSPALDGATEDSVPAIERRGVGFARILVDGKPGPRQVRYVEAEDDPAAIPLSFQFSRFAEVNPEVQASDHCPVFFEVP